MDTVVTWSYIQIFTAHQVSRLTLSPLAIQSTTPSVKMSKSSCPVIWSLALQRPELSHGGSSGGLRLETIQLI